MKGWRSFVATKKNGAKTTTMVVKAVSPSAAILTAARIWKVKANKVSVR